MAQRIQFQLLQRRRCYKGGVITSVFVSFGLSPSRSHRMSDDIVSRRAFLESSLGAATVLVLPTISRTGPESESWRMDWTGYRTEDGPQGWYWEASPSPIGRHNGWRVEIERIRASMATRPDMDATRADFSLRSRASHRSMDLSFAVNPHESFNWDCEPDNPIIAWHDAPISIHCIARGADSVRLELIGRRIRDAGGLQAHVAKVSAQNHA